ncbi:MAG: Xylose isomerase domain protein barrel, partial [Chthoniobacteraceae bacterium]|nr:Xylose isomerase domain protein barrel [Chthoniobacteraceae bacterium]
ENKADVPWGTGKSNVPRMLQELHRQNFQGVFSMEYESKSGPGLVEELKASIATFDKEAAILAGKTK